MKNNFLKNGFGMFAKPVQCALALGFVAHGVLWAQLAPPPLLPANKAVLPSKAIAPPLNVAPTAAPTAPVTPAAPGATGVAARADAAWAEPTWPLRFEMQSGERESTGFAVTQPGPVRVEVRASGVPLLLSLRRPDGRLVERQGSGSIAIDEVANAADIASGVFWAVGLRAVQEPAKPANAAPASNPAQAATKPVASGSISVQHPQADAARAQAAWQQSKALAAQKIPPRPAAASMEDPAAQSKAMAAAAQTEHDKRVAQKHAAALEQLKPTLAPEVHAQMGQRIALRLQGQSLQQASAAQPVRLVKANAALAAPLSTTARLPANAALLGGGKPLTSGAGNSNVATAQSAATGSVSAVGSNVAAAAAAPIATPNLANISTAEGDPGTPVTLSGSDWGDAPGEVHFIVGNGRDITAPITYWSAAQIVTEVPYADGVAQYDGNVYVKRADGAKTPLRAFRFLPLYDVATISLPLTKSGPFDARLAPVTFGMLSLSASDKEVDHLSGGLFGGKGDDEFYLTSRLKNAWLVANAEMVDWAGRPGPGASPTSGAWASITDSRLGTDSPYIKVHWWVDGGWASVSYNVRITVQRPKNLACPANCPIL